MNIFRTCQIENYYNITLLFFKLKSAMQTLEKIELNYFNFLTVKYRLFDRQDTT